MNTFLNVQSIFKIQKRVSLILRAPRVSHSPLWRDLLSTRRHARTQSDHWPTAPGVAGHDRASPLNRVAYGVGVMNRRAPAPRGRVRLGKAAQPVLTPSVAMVRDGHRAATRVDYLVLRRPNGDPLWDHCKHRPAPGDNPRIFPRNPTDPCGPSHRRAGSSTRPRDRA